MTPTALIAADHQRTRIGPENFAARRKMFEGKPYADPNHATGGVVTGGASLSADSLAPQPRLPDPALSPAEDVTVDTNLARVLSTHTNPDNISDRVVEPRASPLHLPRRPLRIPSNRTPTSVTTPVTVTSASICHRVPVDNTRSKLKPHTTDTEPGKKLRTLDPNVKARSHPRAATPVRTCSCSGERCRRLKPSTSQSQVAASASNAQPSTKRALSAQAASPPTRGRAKSLCAPASKPPASTSGSKPNVHHAASTLRLTRHRTAGKQNSER